MNDLDFILRVLRAFNPWSGADKDELSWRFDDGVVSFFVEIGSQFYYATADAESITPANIADFEKAIADCRETSDVSSIIYAAVLFTARQRQEWPLEIRNYPKEIQSLFPERDHREDSPGPHDQFWNPKPPTRI